MPELTHETIQAHGQNLWMWNTNYLPPESHQIIRARVIQAAPPAPPVHGFVDLLSGFYTNYNQHDQVECLCLFESGSTQLFRAHELQAYDQAIFQQATQLSQEINDDESDLDYAQFYVKCRCLDSLMGRAPMLGLHIPKLQAIEFLNWLKLADHNVAIYPDRAMDEHHRPVYDVNFEESDYLFGYEW